MNENEMNIEFSSKSCNEAFARVVVAAFASQLNPTIEDIADIKTAVSEAVTNCIIHGYDGQAIWQGKPAKIHINGKIIDNTLEIEVIDYGQGIDNILMAKQPLYTTKPELDRSGMGFTIMENFMDDCTVESIVGVGTKVIMKKKINTTSKVAVEN